MRQGLDRRQLVARLTTRACWTSIRLVHFPAGEHEELVAAWLWSEQEGIVSHQTALALHRLSDVLPAQTHLTLPSAWERRRFRARGHRAWNGPVPITSVKQTLNDCAHEGFSPELLRQAAKQALRRGLVVKGDLADVRVALKPFGGLSG